jgi:F-type H+-transporting ATPase subunit delta
MQGSSRGSLVAARERLDAILSPGGTAAGALDRAQTGSGLFGVVDLLDANGPLRRGLTDPSQPGDAKAALVARLISGKVAAEVLDLVADAVRSRWSRSRDLADALEELAVSSVTADAEAAGTVDRLEDELFRFERTVAASAELTAALTDRTASVERRTALVDDLVSGKVSPQTRTLLHRALVAPRGRNLSAVLAEYGRLAAARREQSVAHVRVAAPLDPGHRQRLATALAALYGKRVHLNVEVDPQVLGGIRVEVGGEVLDGSIATRLDDVRRRLAG